ncbi:hypothetical protein KIN20_006129 [Parelaphostrongylus tenuis]|uniref:Uncharacterized protein n=1 Tax=Parelaphostrongylus tenuis TaxID=148309 RepID=A0AAD5M1C6_PARTN|nr:hypothetical protein KIN20_006129 [Parelaphostrongylus tenuis]
MSRSPIKSPARKKMATTPNLVGSIRRSSSTLVQVDAPIPLLSSRQIVVTV